MNEMNKPDRYTLIGCHPSELVEKINNAQQLGLRWFARSDYGHRPQVLLYLFFDEAGLQKYLSKEWGSKLDTVAGWVEEYRRNDIDTIVLAERLVELFDDSI